MIFDARVIGLPDYVQLVRERLGKDDSGYETKKLDLVRKAFSRKDSTPSDLLEDLLKRKGSAVSHIYFERYGLLTPLQQWMCAQDGTTPQKVRCENAWTDYLHSVLLGTNDSLIVPLEFSTPLEIDVQEQSYRFPVCSAQRIAREIEQANTLLKVEKTFKMPQVPDFIDARRKETRKLEKEADLDENFWLKFGLVVLRHLVQKSLEHKLPVVLSVRALEPVA